MNAGLVQGYDGIDADAAAFNLANRARTDVNFDSTLLVRFQPDDGQSYTLGLARKNRSPNLYERYAWGTNTIGTITWFGDGNGYTGNPHLKPETADTVECLGRLAWPAHAPLMAVSGHLVLHPPCRTTSACCRSAIPLVPVSPASQLMFANQSAHLYGADVNGGLHAHG